jgi:hypothetical protein
MPDIVLQDLTAIIHGTSRSNGNQFDLVHVETLLQTAQPIPNSMYWYVPNGNSIPPEITDFFKANKIEMYPMSEQKILNGTQDIIQQAQANNTANVEKDASMLLLRSIMVKGNLEQVTGTNNLYRVSYDYKLFPMKDNPNTYEFKVQLPFDGLSMQNGTSTIQLTVIMPLNAQINNTASTAQAPNGQIIQEQITQIPNITRSIVSFRYKQDPLTNIQYHY